MAAQQPPSLPQQALPLAQQPVLVMASQQALSLAQHAIFCAQQSGLSSDDLSATKKTPKESSAPSITWYMKTSHEKWAHLGSRNGTSAGRQFETRARISRSRCSEGRGAAVKGCERMCRNRRI